MEKELILVGLEGALKKMLKDQPTIRKGCSVGTHEFHERVVLDVSGTVTVQADTEYTPTTSIPWKTALALFVRYSGVTGDAAMSALVRAMKEAAELDEEAVKVLSEMADLKEAEKTVQSGLDKLPKAPRIGAVKTALEVVIVEEVAA